MSLDHGILNVPLSRRGDIDREIDRHKAAQASKAAAERKTRAVQSKADKARALEMLAAFPSEKLEALAGRIGKTPAADIGHLRSECHWQPAFVIKVLEVAA